MLRNDIVIENDEQYFALKAVSASQIKTFDKSPYEFWRTSPFNPEKIDEEDKDALSFGSLAHCLLLEPEEVEKRFKIYDWGTKTRSTVKYAKAKEEQSDGKTLILPTEYERANFMLSNIRSHKLAAMIIKGATTELPIVWEDEESGILCKAKIDAIKRTKSGIICIDYKTSGDIDSLLNSAQKFQYPLQAIHYSEAVYQKYGEYPVEFVFIIQSNKTGYEDVVCVANVEFNTQEVAKILWRAHLNNIAQKVKEFEKTQDKDIFAPYPERCLLSYSNYYLNNAGA